MLSTSKEDCLMSYKISMSTFRVSQNINCYFGYSDYTDGLARFVIIRIMALLFSLKLWLISYIGSSLANQHSHNGTQQCSYQAQNTLKVVESINELTKVLNQSLNKYLPPLSSRHPLDFGSLKGTIVYF